MFPIIGLLIAVFIAWGIGYLQSREAEHRYHTPRAYQESAKAAAQRACAGREPGTMFECVAEHVDASKDQANTEQDLSAQQRAASGALLAAIIAFATMIVTIIGVWFVKRTLDATLAAVKDTGLATEAMITQNEISRDTAQRQLRAYVGIKEIVLNAKMDSGGKNSELTFDIFWQNTGQTPARKVKITTNYFTCLGEAEFGEGFDFLGIIDSISVSAIASGQALVTKCGIEVSKIKNYPLGTRLYIWSALEYNDCFADTSRHRSEMCSEILISGFVEGPGIPKVQTRHRGPHNGTDGDCWRQPQTS